LNPSLIALATGKLAAKDDGSEFRGEATRSEGCWFTGGARRLSAEAELAAGKKPQIQVVQYQLRVDFG